MDSNVSAVIYVRTSSEKQNIEGNGLQSQEDRCRAYCATKGYFVAKVFVEAGISGKLYNRPAYNEMIKYIDQANSEIIVVADHIDRITRELNVGLQIIQDLENRNVKLEGPTWEYENSPEGKVFLNIQMSLAQYHRESNARQVRSRTAARVGAGFRSVGGCALGYKTTEQSGLHEPYEPVATVIKEILEGYASGRFNSYSEMARYLNAFKFSVRDKNRQNPRSKKKAKEFIELKGDKVKKNILEKAYYYAGFVENKKLEVPRTKGQHKSIISVETMEFVEKRLRGEKLPVYRRNLNQHFPLTSFLLCSSCEKPMVGAFSGGRKKEYGYYCCKQKGCNLKDKGVRYELVHEQFENLLKGLTPIKGLIEILQDTLIDIWRNELKHHKDHLEVMKSQIKELDIKTEAFLDELVSTSDTNIKRIIKEKMNELTSNKQALEMRLNSTELTTEDLNTVLSSVESLLNEPYKLWKDGDLSKKQVTQQLIFPNRVIYDQSCKIFRKAEKAPIYWHIERFSNKKKLLVGPEGLEPPTNPL